MRRKDSELCPIFNSESLVMVRIAAGILFLFLGADALAQRDCVLRKDEDSIKVYSCAAPNSKFKAIKANFTVNASLSQIVSFVLDASNYVNWQYNTIESSLVEKVNDLEIVYYTKVQAPWPVS